MQTQLVITSATENGNRVENEMVMDEVQASTACQNYSNIPNQYSYGVWKH